jgi:type IV fimbrial biogenesis protein FimT
MNKNKGFTLIELMITVAIMSILLSVGLPSFQSIIASSRLTAATNGMVSALQLARFEAIKQHKLVYVRAKGDIKDNWVKGWEVFVKGAEPFATFDALTTVTVTATYDGTSTSTIYYDESGRAKPTGGHFTFCSDTDFRSVIVSSTGRVRTSVITSCN